MINDTVLLDNRQMLLKIVTMKHHQDKMNPKLQLSLATQW